MIYYGKALFGRGTKLIAVLSIETAQQRTIEIRQNLWPVSIDVKTIS